MLNKFGVWRLQWFFIGVTSIPAAVSLSLLINAHTQVPAVGEIFVTAAIAVVALWLISVALHFFLVRSVCQKLCPEPADCDESSRVLEDMKKVITDIVKGDTTRRMAKTTDGRFNELVFEINSALQKHQLLIVQLTNSTEAVISSAAYAQAGNSQLSSRIDQQGADLKNTAVNLERLNEMTGNTADTAKQADMNASQALVTAQQERVVINRIVTSMADITEASHKIAEIIGVVNDIAFQTKLLALNASVEASRAGEQGAGFALVASEVRNLAQRSAASAHEIRGLVDDSLRKVQTGSKLVNDSGRTLEANIVSVKKVGHQLSEIAVATSKQNEVLSEVNRAFKDVCLASRQNTALAKQSASVLKTSVKSMRCLNQFLDLFAPASNERGQEKHELNTS